MQKWPEPNMKFYHRICVEEQRETTKPSVIDNWSLCRNLGCDPPNTKRESQLLNYNGQYIQQLISGRCRQTTVCLQIKYIKNHQNNNNNRFQ